MTADKKLRTRLAKVGAALLLTGISLGTAAAPISVLVKAREQGQGLLVKRADVCLLLTANHVVGSADRASVVGSLGQSQFGEARILARFEALDLALLRVQGEVTRDCGDSLDAYRTDLSRLLSQRPQGSLPFVFDSSTAGSAGGLSRMPIVVTDMGSDWLRILPQRANDAIEQGRSGSVVLVNESGGDRPAGLLVSVEAEGEGKVLRLERALAAVDRFFRSPSEVAPAQSASQPAKSDPAPPRVTEAPGNLLSLAAGARVVRWTALPSGPEYSPSNLIDPKGGNSWNATLSKSPVDIDFQLAGEQVQSVGRLEFVMAKDQSAARTAREIEVFSSLDGLSWRSFHQGTLFKDEEVKVIELAPIRARWLRLRIYDNWGDATWVALRQFRAYRP